MREVSESKTASYTEINLKLYIQAIMNSQSKVVKFDTVVYRPITDPFKQVSSGALRKYSS